MRGPPTHYLANFVPKTAWKQESPPGERKRHTVRRIASARYAALSNGRGYPIQSWLGETPSSPGWGKPHPVLAGGEGGTPSSPGWGVPHLVLVRVVPNPADRGLTPSSPGRGVPQGTLIYTWDGVAPPGPGIG